MNKLKEIEEKLDLNKKFPGYFSRRWIFKLGMLIIFLYFFNVAYENDFNFENNYYQKCDNDAGCFNLYYECTTSPIKAITILGANCDAVLKLKCKYTECFDDYLSYGETVGKENPTESFINFMIVVLLLCFAINHIIWKVKYMRIELSAKTEKGTNAIKEIMKDKGFQVGNVIKISDEPLVISFQHRKIDFSYERIRSVFGDARARATHRASMEVMLQQYNASLEDIEVNIK
jgi:hypothetical protein